jgi:hypothetical protein
MNAKMLSPSTRAKRICDAAATKASLAQMNVLARKLRFLWSTAAQKRTVSFLQSATV